MKKYLFILFPLCFWGFLFSACQSDDESSPALEDDYKPMLTPGKAWYVSQGKVFQGTTPSDPYWIRVGKDTVLFGEKCVEIIQERTKRYIPRNFIALEKDRKIYYVEVEKDSGNPIFYLMWDFSLQVGDKVPECDMYRNCYCLDIDTIEINGEQYRRLVIGRDKDHILNYWVEGIGPDDWGATLCYKTQYMSAGMPNREVVGCYINDECIFTWDDYRKEATNTTNTVSALDGHK